VLTDSNYCLMLNSFYLAMIDRELLNKYISRGFNEDILTIQNEFSQELIDNLGVAE
jgi:hypothetical protein